MIIRGSCLCGEITYEVSGPFISAVNCHCSRCRRAHGAAFGSYAEFNSGQFRWLSGEKLVKNYGPEKSAYCFCSKCGSNVAATWEGEVVQVTFGTMKGDPRIYPNCHVYVGSKAAWHEIADGKPQYEEWLPDMLDEGA